MPKDDSLYLGHMLDVAREALEMAHGKTREDYDSDKALRVASSSERRSSRASTTSAAATS